MSSNFGGKIKTTAIVLAILSFLGCLIAGIYLIAHSSYRNPTAGIGWAILIGGSLSSWLTFILLYGFGDLLEEAAATRAEIYKIQTTLANMQKKNNPGTQNEAPLFQEPKYPYASSAPAPKPAKPGTGWKCKECGHTNETFRQSCQVCGSNRNY